MRPVDGVVLAAGPSRRFRSVSRASESTPRLKQLYVLEGETLVRRAVRTALASRLAHVVVVVGCEARPVRAEIADLPVTIVENPRFESGQSTSVRAALPGVALGAQAAMFVPCDQPFLDPETIDRLIEAWETTDARIVVPTADGRRRAPVLFGRVLFDELAHLSGDSGGRQLFAAHADSLLEVEVPNHLALADVDTPEELTRLREIASDRPGS